MDTESKHCPIYTAVVSTKLFNPNEVSCALSFECVESQDLEYTMLSGASEI